MEENRSMTMTPEKKGRVCVTGGTGFMASWLIMKLLQHGYAVNTTVRLRSHPPGSSKKDVSFLTNLPYAQERLQIFTADLSDPQSFKPAMEGCVGLFHVAHPMSFHGTTDSADTAIGGTLGILQACIDSKTVKRVVYTSSAATVLVKGGDTGPGDQPLDEGSWSDVEFMKKFNHFGGFGYPLSKTMTEMAALEFAEKHGLNLVSVIPSWIHGPFICPKLPGSVHSSLAMIIGYENQMKYGKNTPFVHIDDCVEAHVYLFEYPEAKGRYICSAVEATVEELYRHVSSGHPELKLLSPESVSDPAMKFWSLSTRKLLETGFKYKYGLKQMFDEAIECCKQKGFL